MEYWKGHVFEGNCIQSEMYLGCISLYLKEILLYLVYQISGVLARASVTGTEFSNILCWAETFASDFVCECC